MNKRIAICIAGEPQYWKYTLDNIKKNLINNNPDYQFDFFLCIFNKKSQYFIDKLIFEYAPKKFKIMNDGNQLDKLYETIKMKNQYETEQKFIYDLVFRIRFELIFNIPINLNDHVFNNNTIYCIYYNKNKSNINYVYDLTYAYLNKNINKQELYDNIISTNKKYNLEHNFGVMDWFLFGDSYSMNFILLIYEHINSLIVYNKKTSISHELYLHIGIIMNKCYLKHIEFNLWKPYLIHFCNRNDPYTLHIPNEIKNDFKKLNINGF